MWKKIAIICMAFIGACSVGYGYYSVQMKATINTYAVGGNVTGRVNMVPNGLSGGDYGLRKGDKLYIGVDNPKDNSPLSFQLIQKETYTDYGSPIVADVNSDREFECVTSSACTVIAAPNNSPITAWISLASEPTSQRTHYADSYTDRSYFQKNYFRNTSDSNYYFYYKKGKTNFDIIHANLQSDIKGKLNDIEILMPMNITHLRAAFLNLFNNMMRMGAAKASAYSFDEYVYEIPEAYFRMNLLKTADLCFAEPYFVGQHWPYSKNGSQAPTAFFAQTVQQNGTDNTSYNSNFNNLSVMRPMTYIKTEDIVFSVSNESGNATIGTIKNFTNASFNNIYTETLNYAPMKARKKDDTLTSTTHLFGIQNSNGNQITKIVKDGTVYLSAEALSGNNTFGVNTVSVLVFNSQGEFVYYKPLETAKGNGLYSFDTTGMSVGKYKIGIVNEVYNESVYMPTDSSEITSVLPLEIVAPLSDLTFTPQSGLQVSNNVNNGDTVGVISSQNGIMPITYTIIADPAYPNEYQHLALKSDGKTVMVNGNPLHAGTYHFKIQAVDTNGDPNPPLEANASFTVDKTNLSVAFDNPNQTKKSIAEATIGWNETATANPTTDTLVTYAKSSGSVALINMDPDTGKITYAGSGGYGKVIIKATADDDPTSGYDDYNPSDTTKEIVIYREVDGSVTPHTNSSSTTAPTFQTSDVNVKPNGVIGKITGTLGTPDDGASGNTTYTYGLKNVDDYNFFSVNPTTGEIKTTADLSTTTGTYHITVTVSDKWSTKEIPITITVGLAGAENLQFYDNSTSNTVINTKTVNFTDTNVSVFATVKNSSNMNPVTYSIQDGSTNVITINPNSGAITIVGTGTVTIVADKQGASGQADSQATLTFTVTAGAQNFIYTTDSTLTTERPKTGNYYDALKETYAPNKTFKVYTTGNPPGSTVTYQLKATSPTDVISVDSDGTIHILNASLNNQIGKVIVEATSHDPSGNYNDVTIELPIDIEKGERKLAFAENPVNVVSGTGSVAPNILVDGVLDTSGTAVIEVDPNESSIAWTNDGITIQYNWNDAQGKDIKLQATKPADRNYKATTVEGKLHILGADENVLTLSTPGKIIYGDHFTIRSTQDDSASTNVQYTFETDNQVFISVPQVNGNKAEFDALAYSGSTTINVKVIRTADGELPLTKTVQIKVLPKPITITIDDKEKKRLEENPPLTFQDFTSQLVSWNGVKDTIDTSHIKLSTTAKKYSPIGSYPITSGNAEKQLNDNYPNYTFTIKQGLLNVVDNGNKDFTDIDDDGCPDINIKITDDDGNEIMINGDINDDGIPDYNIDTNGDGKPDLNIDTDKDGKPDVNLVILKEWKPTKCVTIGDIQFSSGITAKPEINIDLDGDLIPDINIDNKGDFKPHLNISKDGKTPSVNIATIENWKPDQDYKYQGFLYDTIDHKPYLNIDTDGDGRPDVNVDIDGDGNADINVDVDGDIIPDVDIDGDGDGKPDINIDTDGDGNPDENIVDITEWKPEHNVNQPFEYDTVKIENKTELEDNGVTIEKPDGGTFPPSMALKVTDVTSDQKAEVTEKAVDYIGEKQEVKQVFEVKLLQNGEEVQPDGMLKIRVPIAEGYKNAILVRRNEAGEYEKIDATLEDGYLVYESDTLGIVSIIADIEKDVLGSYYPGANMGGALTGDSTNIMVFIGIGCLSLAVIVLILCKQRQEGSN